ncbi:MAG: RimK family alpha-L-glutamate ligase [Alphaproteobacteria bacterium]
MLLIIGGKDDHNVNRLADAAKWRGHPYRLIHTDTDPPPAVHWTPGSPDIMINGETFKADGTSLFIRYDVFGSDETAKKSAFYDALRGWAESYPSVGMLNRNNETLEMNKPRALVLAKECGFDVPPTWITSDFNFFANKNDWIAKPVAGGDYARLLADMPEKADRPWLVQEKLSYPELRLFRAGSHYLAFEITCDVLDYRSTNDFEMKEVAPPPALVEAMTKLTDKLGLDYAAADLKTNPRTGRLEFLEVNTMPMFTGYDDAAQGRLSDAILLTLKKMEKSAAPKAKAAPKP